VLDHNLVAPNHPLGFLSHVVNNHGIEFWSLRPTLGGRVENNP